VSSVVVLSTRLVTAVIAVVVLLSGCAGTSGTAICEAAGGRYAGGTCARSIPGQQAAQERCKTHGGVYLGGQDTCAFGMGR